MHSPSTHAARQRTARHARTRSLGSGLALALLLFAGISTSPAQASQGGLMVSIDGVNYSEGSTLPLFQAMGKVVPGDHRVESVWVRNEASAAGRLRVDLLNPSSDSPDLADELSLSVAEEGGAAPASITIAQGLDNNFCTVLSDVILLEPGESTRIDLTAAVSPALAKREGATGTVSFQLRGVLEEAVAVPLPARPGTSCGTVTPEPPTPPNQRLTTTGIAFQAASLALGVLAVGGGALFGFLAWRRRHVMTARNLSRQI